MAKKKSDIKVHLPKMVSIALLSPHPQNANAQSAYTFNELIESIKTQGFDESVIAIPREDGEGYYIVSGNHRYDAAKQLGVEEIPTVIREDWSPVVAKTEMVKRNNIKGQLDSDRFTSLVKSLSKDVPMDELFTKMAFKSHDEFAKHYKDDKKAQDTLEKILNTKEVSIVDNLQGLVSKVLQEHGNTIASSFIVFPVASNRYALIKTNAALKTRFDALALRVAQKGIDMNLVLAAYLDIAMQASGFGEGKLPDLEPYGYAGDDQLTFVTVGEAL